VVCGTTFEPAALGKLERPEMVWLIKRSLLIFAATIRTADWRTQTWKLPPPFAEILAGTGVLLPGVVAGIDIDERRVQLQMDQKFISLSLGPGWKHHWIWCQGRYLFLSAVLQMPIAWKNGYEY